MSASYRRPPARTRTSWQPAVLHQEIVRARIQCACRAGPGSTENNAVHPPSPRRRSRPAQDISTQRHRLDACRAESAYPRGTSRMSKSSRSLLSGSTMPRRRLSPRVNGLGQSPLEPPTFRFVPEWRLPHVPYAWQFFVLSSSWLGLSIAPGSRFEAWPFENREPVIGSPIVRGRQPVPWDRWTGFHTLFFEQQNTGLTDTSTEFSMCKVADRGLRFRLEFRSGFLVRVVGHKALFCPVRRPEGPSK